MAIPPQLLAVGAQAGAKLLEPLTEVLTQGIISGASAVGGGLKKLWFKTKRAVKFGLGSESSAYESIASGIQAFNNHLQMGNYQFLNTAYGVDTRILDFVKNTKEFKNTMSEFIPGLDTHYKTGGENLMLNFLFPNRANNFFHTKREVIIGNLKNWWVNK